MVKKTEQHPFAGGGFSDLFRGELQDHPGVVSHTLADIVDQSHVPLRSPSRSYAFLVQLTLKLKQRKDSMKFVLLLSLVSKYFLFQPIPSFSTVNQNCGQYSAIPTYYLFWGFPATLVHFQLLYLPTLSTATWHIISNVTPMPIGRA
jgi:hypothetical protein